jgi:superfamily II DNA or RNA helicase
MNNKELEKYMNMEYTYPEPDDPSLQKKLYEKIEFYGNIYEPRDIKTYDQVKEYRTNICARDFVPFTQQRLLSNLINPDTPYLGQLIFHGTGSGKCVLPDTIINGMRAEEIWKFHSRIAFDGVGYWSKPVKIITVRTFDLLNNTMINMPIKLLYRQKVSEYINEVRLEGGLNIKITKAHKLLIHNKQKFNWSNNYKIGDFVKCLNVNHKIISVAEEFYEGFVYDFEIDKHHNYVANGIVCHNTCSAILIAEKFKPLVQKYGNKIYILVNGPVIKEVWKEHILKCTGNTYLNFQDKSKLIDETEKNKAKKLALNLALQYYRLISYRSFYKKVLGDKILEKSPGDEKGHYRKTLEGDYERERSIDRIDNLNNTLIIVEEAHNLTGNAYGQALLKIIRNSKNLRIILLTATPMKNLGSDIIELMNFIRPVDSQIEKDKVFTSSSGHQLAFREGGLEYLKNMCRGYVSYLRGADPLIFADRVEVGTIPYSLLRTKVISTPMLEFQRKIYDNTIATQDDTLDRRSEAVANIVFPALSDDRKELIGLYGREGIVSVRKQLKTHHDMINKKMVELLKDLMKKNNEPAIDIPSELITANDVNKTITGNMFRRPFLKWFSSKFDNALSYIDKLVYGDEGARTAFVYSNLVKVGIELFRETLLQNGWLEYQEQYSNYSITPETICYYCGKPYSKHKKLKIEENIASNKDQELRNSQQGGKIDLNYGKRYDTYTIIGDTNIPDHTYYPATFVTITGKASDESAEMIPEEQQKILRTVFNSYDNREGKYIKLVLGSRVMNEGVSLSNVTKVYILDVYYNLGRVDQVVGRAIRNCSHYRLINDNNRYPKVEIYKFAITLGGDILSSEEELYRKAELKHLLIKLIERALKEVAVDCPLNRNGNIFKEDEKYKDCKPIIQDGQIVNSGEESCPAICDYMKCNFICDDAMLNNDYYDPSRNMYKLIKRNKLDYSTFTNTLARTEIEYAKTKIKEMYRLKYVYKLKDIIDYVKNSYEGHKKELFDDFFVFKALDELIPVTENDFNNFKDAVLDKFNHQGYLIYRKDYYIFQPSNENEDVPMHYRTTYAQELYNKLSLYNYMKNTIEYKYYKGETKKKQLDEKMLLKKAQTYDFDAVREYYDQRNENEIVGIIDKELGRKDSRRPDEIKDVFKIRNKREKILTKKRGVGIPSMKGAVCQTSKTKEFLEDIAINLGVRLKKSDPQLSRNDICDLIQNRLLELEKYNKENKTYVIVPKNHPVYKFPYNLNDRVEYILSSIKEKIKFSLDIKTDKIINDKDKDKYKYIIKIKTDQKLDQFKDFLEKMGATLQGKEWVINVS